jgi:CMP-N-acetylneuraminic acid synthetase
MSNHRIVIPARKGSKGFPMKNRFLLPYTLNCIPQSMRNQIYIDTDDYNKSDSNSIVNIAKQLQPNINIYQRPADIAADHTPIKPVLENISTDLNWMEDDVIIMLYLTYPRRQWGHVKQALELFYNNQAKSLLCKKPVKSHPYLCMYEEPYNKATPVVEHNLHRRQDYPACFEISHYIAITKVSELQSLKNNIYNSNTVFYSIPNYEYHELDVDTYEDYLNI